jgi:LysM repeat protein
MSVRPVFPGSPEPSSPRADATSWVVQPGDTLSAVARQLQGQGVPGTTAELVRTLARLNGIDDPDRIEVGQLLTLPPRAERAQTEGDLLSVAGRTLRHGAGTLRMQVDEQRTRLENALLRWIRRLPAEPLRLLRPGLRASGSRIRPGGPSASASPERGPRSPRPAAPSPPAPWP